MRFTSGKVAQHCFWIVNDQTDREGAVIRQSAGTSYRAESIDPCAH